jgi:ATP-dependent RNA helicase DDX3X
MKDQHVERPRGSRAVYPFAVILSPTRELACQIHDEAKKFSYQTGVKVVVAYGGTPIHQQQLSLTDLSSASSFLPNASLLCQHMF